MREFKGKRKAEFRAKGNEETVFKVLKLYMHNNFNASQTSRDVGTSMRTIKKWWGMYGKELQAKENVETGIITKVDKILTSKQELIDYSFGACKQVIDRALELAQSERDLDKISTLIGVLNELSQKAIEDSFGAKNGEQRLSANEMIRRITNIQQVEERWQQK